MLFTMKTLNLGRLKKEFLMLTAFHGHKFCDEIQSLEGVDDSVKSGFHTLVSDFMKDLYSMAEIDSEAFAEELGKNSAFFNNVREAAKAAGQESTKNQTEKV